MKNCIWIALAAATAAACAGPVGPQSPVDKQATAQTKALYVRLSELEGVMFGHQDATLYGYTWRYEPGRSDVREVCGDYPAVYGWELGDMELGRDRSLDGVPFDRIREHLVAAYLRGGVNTVSWHCNNPVTGGNAWDARDVRAVASLLPGAENHGFLLESLDRLAAFFQSLRTPDGTAVPVIFRPWHEHTGDWFWWGAAQSSREDYIALWRFTVDYLRYDRGVHNLLYAFSPDIVSSEEDYLDRYPGDDYVDILGADCYYGKDSTYVQSACRTLDVVERLAAAKRKVGAFTETGYEGVPGPVWWTGTLLPIIRDRHIAYVMVWRNAYREELDNHFFAPYSGTVSAEDFNAFYASPVTLFENDLPEMYR